MIDTSWSAENCEVEELFASHRIEQLEEFAKDLTEFGFPQIARSMQKMVESQKHARIVADARRDELASVLCVLRRYHSSDESKDSVKKVCKEWLGQ